jgi:dipeptidyl aminopeptidase/acylaminoacyl peptidase
MHRSGGLSLLGVASVALLYGSGISAQSTRSAVLSAHSPTEPSENGTAPLRPFTVRESIELSTFVDAAQPFGPQTSQVSFSPDRSQFVAVTMRGDVASGKREATLWLFDSDTARAYVAGHSSDRFGGARALTRFASAANVQPMSNWRWTSDGKSILFLGADDGGAKRLYHVDLHGDVVALSQPDLDISRFDEQGGTIVYVAHPPIRPVDMYQAGGPSLPDIQVATGKNILPLLFPNFFEATPGLSGTTDQLWAIDHGAPAPRRVPIQLRNSTLVLSPDGRHLLVTEYVKHIPKSWERYQPLLPGKAFKIVGDTPETEGSTGVYRLRQYVLVDLATGTRSVLVDAPIELNTEFSAASPQWTADGSRLALLGAYPPLSAASGVPEQAVLPCAIMVVSIATHGRACLETARPIDATHGYGDRMQLVVLRWRNADRELLAEFAAPNAPDNKVDSVFSQVDGKWTSRQIDAAPPRDALTVKVNEALDQSPVLNGRIGDAPARLLLDPNPQLKDIALGSVALYRWRDADGSGWSGALVKPPNFVAGRRYPLVIQTHNLDRSKFLVDGPSATGFAARALAARDIVVLQVDEIGKNSGTPKESETGASGYRAAIAQLAREGIIDTTKVGIITWSHMGPYVLQGLVDNPKTYAAATFAEAGYNSYGEYLMNIDYLGSQREQLFRDQVGTKPFGAGLATWLDRSAGFHTDRICTPMLFQFNSPVSLVYGWDIYAALRAQQKPVELFYMRNGEHVLVKPLERLSEQGMNVDWYDYWLNGHKDSDPAKADQYKRWDAMKALRQCAP